MPQETRTCVCRVPQNELWDLLADYGNVVALSSPGSSARLSAGSPRSCGCLYAATIEWQGSTSSFTACLVEASRPATLTWQADTALGASSIRFDLEPIDPQSTLVRITSWHRATETGRELEPMAWGLLKTSLEHTALGLSQLHAE